MRRPHGWFERRQDDLTDEIETHLAMAIHERVARGEPIEAATAAARREFGNRGEVRASARDAWGWIWLEQLLVDLHYGLRKLRLAPGFAAVATLSLAIGIGATVTMYAVVDAADIRGLPYPRADRLVVVEQTVATRSGPGPQVVRASPAPAATTAKWLNATHTFAATSRVGLHPLRWVHDDETEALDLAAVGPRFFPILGAAPILGRTIAPADTNADAPGVIVLSYAFWRDRLGADRNVIGRRLDLDTSDVASASREKYAIIGVMPEQADFPAATNGWTADRSGSQLWAIVLGRLRDGMTASAATAELRAITQNLPVSGVLNTPPGIRVTGLRESVRSKWSGTDDIFTIDSARGRAVRLAIVFFVLLIAMINVGNLLLARSAARDHEMRVRSALGASRARLARQLLVEGGCIALMGGLAGVLLARWGIGLAGSFGALKLNGIVPTLDWRVLGFALVLTMAVAIGTGFIPVVALLRAGGGDSPKASAGRPQTRVQNALMVAQVGAALTLLTGAGVLGKELLRVEKQGFGFDQEHVFAFQNLRPPAGTRSVQFRDDVLFHLARLPGVVSVAEYEALPNQGFYPVGDRAKAGTSMFDAQGIAISPGFLKNLKIPVVVGRDFTDADYATDASVALVSSSAATRFWPGQGPIGRQVIIPPPMRRKGDTTKVEPLTVTVVGVTRDIRLGRVLGPPPMTLMRPAAAKVGFGMSFFVRTTNNADATLPALRHELNVLQGTPLTHAMFGSLQTLGIDRQLAEERVTTRALAVFAAVALLLAVLGIHGLVSYAVAQRTREIGIRMALGAESRTVLLLVTRRGLTLAGAGIVCGVGGAFALSRAIRAMLYGTSPTDPTVFVGSALLLAMAVLVASYLPARRATRVDPMIALRVD